MELIIKIFQIVRIRQRVIELNISFSIRCLGVGHFNSQVFNFGRSQVAKWPLSLLGLNHSVTLTSDSRKALGTTSLGNSPGLL